MKKKLSEHMEINNMMGDDMERQKEKESINHIVINIPLNDMHGYYEKSNWVAIFRNNSGGHYRKYNNIGESSIERISWLSKKYNSHFVYSDKLLQISIVPEWDKRPTR